MPIGNPATIAVPSRASSMSLAVMLSDVPSAVGSSFFVNAMTDRLANKRSGVDAGWRILFAFQRPWPRATHRERWMATGAL